MIFTARTPGVQQTAEISTLSVTVAPFPIGVRSYGAKDIILILHLRIPHIMEKSNHPHDGDGQTPSAAGTIAALKENL